MLGTNCPRMNCPHLWRKTPGLEAALAIIRRLEEAGLEAWLVGGAVRDHLLGREPADYDVATAALPEQVMILFPRSVPTGLRHGTVTVLSPVPEGAGGAPVAGGGPAAGGVPIEVTTYRVESGYADRRHPDQVQFVTAIEPDLARRDFTVNALAWHPDRGVVGPPGWQEDLERRVLRAVGDPEMRFDEDPLRMLRAVRLAAELPGFRIEEATWEGLVRRAPTIAWVSAERVREEWMRLLLSPGPDAGLRLLHSSGLLAHILPELEACAGVTQNQHHRWDVLEHTFRVVALSPPDAVVRLAAALHDIGKPASLTTDAAGRRHFYGHQRLSARMADEALFRLRFDNATRREVVQLVAEHMRPLLSPDTDERRLRRYLNRLGERALRRLAELQRADLVATGSRDPEAVDALFRRVLSLLGAVLAEGAAFRLQDLAVNGRDLMQELGRPPGPWVGRTLRLLLERVLADPALNQREVLLATAREIARDIGRDSDRGSRAAGRVRRLIAEGERALKNQPGPVGPAPQG